MRPPICAICNDRFSPSEGGDLVYFATTDEEKASIKHMKDQRMVGHPPGREWFCEKHLEQARQLSHLTQSEAISKIRSNRFWEFWKRLFKSEK